VCSSDLALWFTEIGANAVGRMTLDGTFTEFPLPVAGAFVGEIVAGPDGALWLTEQEGDAVDRVAVDGQITRFPLPVDSLPGPIVAAPDGALWIAERNRGVIARMTTDGVVTAEHPLADPTADPFALTVGPDGALWISELENDAVARMTLDGTVTREIRLPGGRPVSAAAGPDGALWVAENGGQIARVDIGFDPPVELLPAAFKAVAGFPSERTVARFTDADPNARPQDYAASIDWGDGTTSAGFVRRTAEGFTVRGLHAYFLPGSYRVVVRLAEAADGHQLGRVVSEATVR